MAEANDLIKLLSSDDNEIQSQTFRDIPNDVVIKVPDLRDNQDFHLFVCYNQESFDRVQEIVKNLEQLGLKCCYHERDFVPGQNVLGNINQAIDSSAGTLLVLCEEFVKSKFCTHEVEQALHAKLSTGYTIIPIMIEPCTYPELLKSITYIDARSLDVNEMHLKIYDAFVNNEWYKDRQIGNSGLAMKFPLSKYNIWWKRLSVVRYRLIFTDAERNDVWKNGFEIPDEDFAEIERTVSESEIVKNKHVFKLFKRLITFVFGLIEALVILLGMIIHYSVLKRTKTVRTTDDLPISIFNFILILYIIIIAMEACGKGCSFKRWKGFTHSQKERSKSLLALTLWKRINRQSLQGNNFVVIYNKSTVHLLKLNVNPCKEYLTRRCSKTNSALTSRKRVDESNQAYVERIIGSFMKVNCHMLLEKSQVYGRHFMANGAKCLCQLVEEHELKLSNDSHVVRL